MGCFRLITNYCEDVWDRLRNNKWKSILTALVCVAGIALGAVLFNVFKYGWWFDNRVSYAEKLFQGSFSLFFSFLLWTAAFYFCMLLSNLIPATRFLNYFLLFVACFYCGANTAAAIYCWTVWGVLFAIFATLWEVIGYYLACIATCTEPTGCSKLNEAFCDFKPTLAVLIVAFLIKIIGFFVILKIITAII